MADYEEIFMELGINIPPEMMGTSQTDSSWHQRLKKVMDTVAKGTWVAVAEGSLTHMRVYRSTFRKGDMNIPAGAVFECAVLKIPNQSHRGRLAFRYMGQYNDPELEGKVHQHEKNGKIWFLMEYDKYVPRQKVENKEPYLSLDRAGILAYLEQQSDSGVDDEDLGDMLKKWEDEHNWTELTEHAAATERLAEALSDLDKGKVQGSDVADQPADPQAPPPPAQDDVNGREDPAPVTPSSDPVPEAEPASVTPGPCPASPSGQHDYAQLLQGAPPVCLYCDQEQPNDAPVQQIVQPESVVVADPPPPFPNLQQQLANRNAVPAADEPIPGLEDMS